MPINGVTSQLSDQPYIQALEAAIRDLQKRVTNLEASQRSLQSR